MRLHWIVRRLAVRPSVRYAAWSHALQIDFLAALGAGWTYSRKPNETEWRHRCEWQQDVRRRTIGLEIHTGEGNYVAFYEDELDDTVEHSYQEERPHVRQAVEPENVEDVSVNAEHRT